MKAYAIFTETVTNEAELGVYRKQVGATLAPFKGQLIVRGGNFTVFEGKWPDPLLVIIEFPSREAAEGWYKSPEYQKLIPMRLKGSTANMIIVDGAA